MMTILSQDGAVLAASELKKQGTAEADQPVVADVPSPNVDSSQQISATTEQQQPMLTAGQVVVNPHEHMSSSSNSSVNGATKRSSSKSSCSQKSAAKCSKQSAAMQGFMDMASTSQESEAGCPTTQQQQLQRSADSGFASTEMDPNHNRLMMKHLRKQVSLGGVGDGSGTKQRIDPNQETRIDAEEVDIARAIKHSASQQKRGKRADKNQHVLANKQINEVHDTSRVSATTLDPDKELDNDEDNIYLNKGDIIGNPNSSSSSSANKDQGRTLDFKNIFRTDAYLSSQQGGNATSSSGSINDNLDEDGDEPADPAAALMDNTPKQSWKFAELSDDEVQMDAQPPPNYNSILSDRPPDYNSSLNNLHRQQPQDHPDTIYENHITTTDTHMVPVAKREVARKISNRPLSLSDIPLPPQSMLQETSPAGSSPNVDSNGLENGGALRTNGSDSPTINNNSNSATNLNDTDSYPSRAEKSPGAAMLGSKKDMVVKATNGTVSRTAKISVAGGSRRSDTDETPL